MSTHRHIDKICCAVLAFILALTGALGVLSGSVSGSSGIAMAYEEKLFDASYVHTIEIVMDDWEGFLETCENEEYTACSVIIDNDAYKNVGIRAKGNTSLSSVAAYGNDRYSFKIEFDKYVKGKTYYGLDKISLNNIIQDNTYMKDFLVYQMMGYFGVDAPLCSYVYITVNGEEWGLYLAVEGVEEGFLERNYGTDYGELYKPDSTSMGGGRGNGGKFDMDEFQAGWENQDAGNGGEAESGGQAEAKGGQDSGNRGEAESVGQAEAEENRDAGNGGEAKSGGQAEAEENQDAGNGGEAENDGQAEAEESQDSGKGGETADGQDAEGQEVSGGFHQRISGGQEREAAQGMPEQPPGGETGEMQEFPDGWEPSEGEEMPGGMAMTEGNADFSRGMGSEDVSLIYSDDEYDSYSNIFDQAKTDITDADKDRLIASLKTLNEGENIEEAVDIDEVIRYFVVHNFVCNFDSYTGSMIHNYYLYEEDGVLTMIPWDYNLAFGGFMGGGDATDYVNYPIDSPVSGGTIESRPMLAWIFADEEYTEQYHQYFAEFISSYFDSGYFAEMIDSVIEMISSYVEKDPTKFCTYEEFEEGAETLKSFCLLRAESINGQLSGTVPSTSEGQAENPAALIDASGLQISAMGSMNSGGMMGGRSREEGLEAGNMFPGKKNMQEGTEGKMQPSLQETDGG